MTLQAVKPPGKEAVRVARDAASPESRLPIVDGEGGGTKFGPWTSSTARPKVV